MVQALSGLVTFEEFINWYPANGRYELIDGVIVEMQPTGKHEEIVAFLYGKLFLEIHRLQLPYFLPKQALVKPTEKPTGYLPDVLVVKRETLIDEPLWEKSSTITKGKSICLIVEVVSTNWRDDYGYKLTDYETMGIPEYWIVDYLALGGRRYLGFPKQPTITVCNYSDDEYQLQQFRGDERIISNIFPDLNLTVNQLLLRKYPP